MSARGPRVVVIGGGVIGCAVAWRLASGGARVILLERDEPGAHASSAAAGMLSPLKEADEPGPFLDLGIRSLERYPEFVRAVESASRMSVGYRQEGRLDVAFDDEGAETLRRQHGLQRDAGYESRLLEPAELRRLEPGLAPDARLGLATPHDHQVDSQRLVRALWIAARQEGVDVRDHTPAATVMLDDDGRRVRGVSTSAGEAIEADGVVVAAGPWSGGLGLRRPVPVRPVRGQIVVLRAVPQPVRRVTWGPGCYLVPRPDGRLLVGATMEEAGYEPRVTADAVRALLDRAIRVLPALGQAAVEGFQVGLRPAMPDGHPVIGADPDTAGLAFATGHFRNGILLAPETAERVAAAVFEGATAEPAFAPDRFG